MKFINIGNGAILFLKTEPAPKTVPGYYADKDDPWLWFPEWPDCEHRKLINYTRPCGKLGTRVRCTHFNKETNVQVCLACEKPDG
mgnify:CR=1 FL=1